ncbi:MAG: CotH kinase family protein [Clostridia bacterium]|nr:CotH kinase family protein [Clostridia bacterium]
MQPRIAAALLIMLAVLLTLPALALPGGFSAETASVDMNNPAAQLALESGLPVLSITTAEGTLPDEDDMAASLIIYQTNGGRLQAVSTLIEINERGNTSRRFPKKSYRVKIVDADGEKDNLSIAGLRSDDDWILNPMYTDTSKIRETLAYRLWEEINTSSAFAASSRVAYCEVYINGEYWGLYGIQERIDRKQVDGDKRSGILYKVIANDRPTVDELLTCESNEVCRGFELAFAGAGVKSPWEPAAAYMALLNGEDFNIRASLSMENTIDYGLWAMLCQAHDCHFKNQFLNCVYNGSSYTMYKIPWDLNNTFGDIWQNDAEDTNHTAFHAGDLVIDGAFGVLLDSGDPQIYSAIQSRWQDLRAAAITEENLIDTAHAIYTPLIAAIERDSLRWPACGMGNGNAVNIRDIESYIRETLPKMDEFIFGLGAEQ